LAPALTAVIVVELADAEKAEIFRPSAADKIKAPALLTLAVTPVDAVLALIAARKTPVLSPASTFAVASIAKPLT
jgi:hypothetical protein